MVSVRGRRHVQVILTLAALGALMSKRMRKKRSRKKRTRQWVKHHLLKRGEFGASNTTIRTFRKDDQASFLKYFRMTVPIFDWLLSLVSPLIQHQDTPMRLSISPRERLEITIYFLAHGDSYRSLELLFLVSERTISSIVPEVCDAIYAVLRDKYMKCPSTPSEWKKVADEFWKRWQVPNCLGALDGKHVTMKAPDNSGSAFFNYKGTHSLVLMALVYARYRFLYVDVGANGRVSDGGVFAGCTLQKALERRSSMFPAPQPCPGDECPIPFFMVADDAFGLTEAIMKPYSYQDLAYETRIFNYRLSRGRRVVENGFGILANKWRIYQRKIALRPSIVQKIILATCAMHKMARDEVGMTKGLVDLEAADGKETVEQAAMPAGTNSTKRA